MKIEKLKVLVALLGTSEIILTGSQALAYHGLLDAAGAKDIDIIVINPSEATTAILQRLHTAMPSPTWREGSHIKYSFIYEDVKIDVWEQNSHEDVEYLYTDYGIKVASVRSIVKSKVSYNRPKDWMQLMQMSRKIFNPKTFEESVDKIPTDISNDYPIAK